MNIQTIYSSHELAGLSSFSNRQKEDQFKSGVRFEGALLQYAEFPANTIGQLACAKVLKGIAVYEEQNREVVHWRLVSPEQANYNPDSITLLMGVDEPSFNRLYSLGKAAVEEVSQETESMIELSSETVNPHTNIPANVIPIDRKRSHNDSFGALAGN